MAGGFPLGFGPAGVAPPYAGPNVAHVLVPRAVKYDPSIRQLVLADAQGNPTDVHPVDQIVAYRLTASKTESGSSPNLGTRIRARCRTAAPSAYAQIGQQEAASELADLIASGDVQLLGVVTQVNQNNAIVYVISYQNLRQPGSQPQTVLV